MTKLKLSITLGFLAAILLSAALGASLAYPQKETFLFPQFTTVASSDKNSVDAVSDEITYSFKLAEIFKKFFR
ncbi:MAG: hypothetical protein LUE12_06095 [Ruminococcus sp.]|nr:hypothetical protein [Ruminococcus sp.]